MSVDREQLVDDAAAVAKAVVAAKPVKAFWKSKRFWTTIATVGLHYSGYLPGPAAVVVPLVANIVFPLLDAQVEK